MRTIQITLTVTLDELNAITALLCNTSSEAHTEPVTHKQTLQEQVPEKDLEELVELPTTTAGSNIKMPNFGRSKTQIANFVQHEAQRIEKKEEEQIAKDERKEIRETKKAIKQAIIQEKENEAIKEEQVVKTIQQKAVETTDSKPIKNPFKL